MKTMFLEEIEVRFNDFTEEMQKKFYEAKKDEFREEASKSQLASIRKLVAEDEGTSNAVLNEMLKEEVTNEDKQEPAVLEAIFKREHFTITEENQKLCAKSSNWTTRLWIVKDENTSNELLNEILKEEVTDKDKKDLAVLNAIFERKDFAITEENQKLCAKSSNLYIRLLIVKDKNTSNELLNEMLKEEITNEDKQELAVLKAIFSREDFAITEENQKFFVKSSNWRTRLFIVEDKNTSNELLNEILKEEVTNEDKQDDEVLLAIFEREDFAITKENKRICKRLKKHWIHKLAY